MVYLAVKTGKTGTEHDYLVFNGLPEFSGTTRLF